jgi:polysaccharide export outer membrane protein
MAFLGQLKASGKTPEDLGKQIADGLRGEYLTEPQVTVMVVQYNSRSLFVQGAVRNPGVYVIEGRPSLLKLITMAGGLADNHGSTAFIIREMRPGKPDSTGAMRVASDTSTSVGIAALRPAAVDAVQTGAIDEEDGKYEMRQVNINSLLKGNFSQNLVIQPGDIINIPNGDVFFVAGEVRSPGSFPLKEGTTLRQAISLAQGVTFRAKLSLGIIFREDPKTAKRQEIKVDIADVMAGKKDDIPIQANDIVIVPNSRLKSVTQTLLSAFGTSATRIPIP